MRWWRRHAGVRVRSTVAATAMVTLALLLSMLSAWWLLQRAVTNSAFDALTARSEEIAALVERSGTAALDPQNQPVFGEIIQVLSPSGDVLVAAPPSASRVHLVHPVPRPPAEGAMRLPPIHRPRTDEPYFLVARDAHDAITGEEVVVVVGRSARGLSETLGTVGKFGLAGLPLLVIVTAAVTYLSTGRALAPVEDMRRRVQSITSRRLDERLPVPAVRDEIGRLAETMNDMLATLQAAQQAQRQFVADAGHELRSPLAVIATTLEVARSEGGTSSERGLLLDDVTAETARMSRIVDDLLLLARADERGLRLGAADVDLDDLVEGEARRLRTCGEHEVTVRTEPVRLTGDRDRLAQVLRNLADNAARHARHRLHLELRRDGAEAVIRVEDDGPGVAPADRTRVFERFVRLDASRQRGSGGAGLGLAIVKEIVTGHGGRVSIRDSDLGGACAEVRLPAPPPDPGDEQ